MAVLAGPSTGTGYSQAEPFGLIRIPDLYSNDWSGARDLNPGPHGPEM
jgi:hypothetical protein